MSFSLVYRFICSWTLQNYLQFSVLSLFFIAKFILVFYSHPFCDGDCVWKYDQPKSPRFKNVSIKNEQFFHVILFSEFSALSCFLSSLQHNQNNHFLPNKIIISYFHKYSFCNMLFLIKTQTPKLSWKTELRTSQLWHHFLSLKKIKYLHKILKFLL